MKFDQGNLPPPALAYKADYLVQIILGDISRLPEQLVATQLELLPNECGVLFIHQEYGPIFKIRLAEYAIRVSYIQSAPREKYQLNEQLMRDPVLRNSIKRYLMRVYYSEI